jgi:TolB-like protein
MVVLVGLMVYVFSTFSSCVSQPRYSDYMGLPKEEALADLRSDKTKNTVKLVCNWLLWGCTTFWVSSVVDTIRYIDFNGDFKTIEGRINNLEGNETAGASPVSRTVGLTTGIEGAINRASETLISELTSGSTIAVLSVAARDRDTASFVMDELEFQMVDSRQFKMVDRKTLDTIRSEQNFQLSGDVSDSSAVEIGNMLGANIVITGTITGSGNTQRLTLKALDVKTAQIITMAREQY